MCTLWKRFKICHCIFALLVTICFLFFTALGILLLVIVSMSVSELEDLCSITPTGDKSDFQKAMDELYSSADSVYCVTAAAGCYCQISHSTAGARRTYSTSGSGSQVTNVQGCASSLATAYANYNVCDGDTSCLTEYFDYFGEIEDEYTCSGICTHEAVYYFYNSNAGAPTQRCMDPIIDEILEGEIQNMGIGYLCSGILLFAIWFVQYGLCCRKKPNTGMGKTRN